MHFGNTLTAVIFDGRSYLIPLPQGVIYKSQNLDSTRGKDTFVQGLDDVLGQRRPLLLPTSADAYSATARDSQQL